MPRRDTIKRLLQEMAGKYRAALALVFFFILISTVAGVAGSFFIQQLVDDYIAPLLTAEKPVFDGLFRALCVLASVYLLGVLSSFAYNRVVISISQGVQKKIRDNLFAHMQTLPIRYFDTHTHGDLMSHYTNDIDTLREFFSMSLPQMLSSVFTIIAVSAVMLSLSGPLSLVVLVFVVITLYVTKRMSTMAVRNFVKLQRALGGMNGFVKEMINGQKVIKVFCHEQATIDTFEEKNQALRGYGKTASRLTNMIMPIVMNIAALQYVVVAYVGGMLALRGVGGVTLGTIAAFLTLSRSLSGPIGQISQQVNAVTMALAGAGRIFEMMDEQPEVDDGCVTLVHVRREGDALIESAEPTGIWAFKQPCPDGGATYTELRGDVRLFDVDFGYEQGELVLHDVSLYAKPGQKIAFVGATGAGKTTITNLINWFYDITDGQILYDGINIREIKKADLRRSLGIVLQDTHLFSGTIADNIRYGRLSATDAEVRKAAMLANAHEFIMRLPEGYDTYLSGDGGNLSGGQRQLLSIARAAIANPPVMIMDEATSSIDTRTEAIVQRGMDGLMEGRTVFVIAHRLSTVKNARAIIVLERGRIIERGDHDELIAQKGKYYQLYTGAFAD